MPLWSQNIPHIKCEIIILELTCTHTLFLKLSLYNEYSWTFCSLTNNSHQHSDRILSWPVVQGKRSKGNGWWYREAWREDKPCHKLTVESLRLIDPPVLRGGPTSFESSQTKRRLSRSTLSLRSLKIPFFFKALIFNVQLTFLLWFNIPFFKMFSGN